MKIHIVMVEPEIPQNTGNIARTCAATGGKLHLVKPLGFDISDKYLKRAGLDYWDKLNIEEHESLAEFLKKYEPEKYPMFFATTKGTHVYSDVKFSELDEVFVLLEGAATLYTCDSLEGEVTVTKLQNRIAYNVEAGTWHHLAVSEDAVVFVAESGSMQPDKSEAGNVEAKGLVAEV